MQTERTLRVLDYCHIARRSLSLRNSIRECTFLLCSVCLNLVHIFFSFQHSLLVFDELNLFMLLNFTIVISIVNVINFVNNILESGHNFNPKLNVKF